MGPSSFCISLVHLLSHSLCDNYFTLLTHSVELQYLTANGLAFHFTEKRKQLEESFLDIPTHIHTLVVGFPTCYCSRTVLAPKGNLASALDESPPISMGTWLQESSITPIINFPLSTVLFSFAYKPSITYPIVIYNPSLAPIIYQLWTHLTPSFSSKIPGVFPCLLILAVSRAFLPISVNPIATRLLLGSFQRNSSWLPHHLNLRVVYLKFKFNWASCIFICEISQPYNYYNHSLT